MRCRIRNKIYKNFVDILYLGDGEGVPGSLEAGVGEVHYHAQPVHLLYHSLKQRHCRIATKFVNFAAFLLFAKNITSILSYKINLK